MSDIPHPREPDRENTPQRNSRIAGEIKSILGPRLAQEHVDGRGIRAVFIDAPAKVFEERLGHDFSDSLFPDGYGIDISTKYTAEGENIMTTRTITHGGEQLKLLEFVFGSDGNAYHIRNTFHVSENGVGGKHEWATRTNLEAFKFIDPYELQVVDFIPSTIQNKATIDFSEYEMIEGYLSQIKAGQFTTTMDY